MSISIYNSRFNLYKCRSDSQLYFTLHPSERRTEREENLSRRKLCRRTTGSCRTQHFGCHRLAATPPLLQTSTQKADSLPTNHATCSGMVTYSFHVHSRSSSLQGVSPRCQTAHMVLRVVLLLCVRRDAHHHCHRRRRKRVNPAHHTRQRGIRESSLCRRRNTIYFYTCHTNHHHPPVLHSPGVGALSATNHTCPVYIALFTASRLPPRHHAPSSNRPAVDVLLACTPPLVTMVRVSVRRQHPQNPP